MVCSSVEHSVNLMPSDGTFHATRLCSRSGILTECSPWCNLDAALLTHKRGIKLLSIPVAFASQSHKLAGRRFGNNG